MIDTTINRNCNMFRPDGLTCSTCRVKIAEAVIPEDNHWMVHTCRLL